MTARRRDDRPLFRPKRALARESRPDKPKLLWSFGRAVRRSALRGGEGGCGLDRRAAIRARPPRWTRESRPPPGGAAAAGFVDGQIRQAAPVPREIRSGGTSMSTLAQAASAVSIARTRLGSCGSVSGAKRPTTAPPRSTRNSSCPPNAKSASHIRVLRRRCQSFLAQKRRNFGGMCPLGRLPRSGPARGAGRGPAGGEEEEALPPLRPSVALPRRRAWPARVSEYPGGAKGLGDAPVGAENRKWTARPRWHRIRRVDRPALILRAGPGIQARREGALSARLDRPSTSHMFALRCAPMKDDRSHLGRRAWTREEDEISLSMLALRDQGLSCAAIATLLGRSRAGSTSICG